MSSPNKQRSSMAERNKRKSGQVPKADAFVPVVTPKLEMPNITSTGAAGFRWVESVAGSLAGLLPGAVQTGSHPSPVESSSRPNETSRNESAPVFTKASDDSPPPLFRRLEDLWRVKNARYRSDDVDAMRPLSLHEPLLRSRTLDSSEESLPGEEESFFDPESGDQKSWSLRQELSSLKKIRAELKAMMHSKEKVKKRLWYLMENPAARIQVDTQRLRTLIPSFVFKVHPNSSVAGNRAILGSDIDAGIVVTEDEVPVGMQLEFIQELRRQGFDVYHPSETKGSMVKEINSVHFFKKRDIEAQDNMDIDKMIYLAGSTVM